MRILFSMCLAFGLMGCANINSQNKFVASVSPIYETQPIGTQGDAADDPAIWVSKDKKSTRIIGTQKKGGLYVYNIEGKITQEILGGRPNNIDLVQDFIWPDGNIDSIVFTSDRIDNAIGIYRFNDNEMKLIANSELRIPSQFAEIYGVCAGKINNQILVAATSKIGEVKIFNLTNHNNKIEFELINQFNLGSISEGCVFDEIGNNLFVAQELVGLWKVENPHQKDFTKKLIDEVKTGNLVADVEGVTIWNNGKIGYLIVSVQGANRYNFYSLGKANNYLGTFAISANEKIDGVTGTDGIAVNAVDLGGNLKHGYMVAQDDINTMPNETQNFKIIAFEDILKLLNLPF